MEFLRKGFFIVSHMHKYIDVMVNTLGYFTYAIIGLNMILETGGLILGFLPGDSLVVAVAAYSAYKPDKLSVFALLILIILTTFIGDCMSFHIGKYFGKKYKKKRSFKFFSEEQFDQVHNFFMKNGKKAFFINRFIPFARAWLPFTAGFTQTQYKKIAPYNFVGCTLWTSVYITLGYFFGNTRFVRNNFSIILVIVMITSSIPAAIMLFINRHKIRKGLMKKTESDKTVTSNTSLESIKPENKLDSVNSIDSSETPEDSESTTVS